MAISVSFPFSWAAQPRPGAQPLWVLVFSTASYLQLIWSPNSLIGAWGLLLLGAGFLYHILSPNSLNFLCTELCNSSTSTQYLPITGHRNMHFLRLWNGMFDRHRVEINVTQFTGHPLPVHQFVTVPWDFNPVPYCQPSSPTPMQYALPPSLEWHVWPGRRSIYNNLFAHSLIAKQFYLIPRLIKKYLSCSGSWKQVVVIIRQTTICEENSYIYRKNIYKRETVSSKNIGLVIE